MLYIISFYLKSCIIYYLISKIEFYKLTNSIYIIVHNINIILNTILYISKSYMIYQNKKFLLLLEILVYYNLIIRINVSD